MDNKMLKYCLVTLAVLVLLTAAGVFFLYSGGQKSGRPVQDPADSEAAARDAAQAYPLLAAVPSDAAMIMTFGSLRSAREVLTDSTKVFSALSGGIDRMLAKAGKNSCDGGSAVVSMHYSGSIVPLVVVRTDGKTKSAGGDGSAAAIDTTAGMKALLAAASSMKMSADLVDCSLTDNPSLRKGVLMLISPSASLVSSSRRHIENNSSVLDKAYFPETAAQLGGKEALIVSHDYASKLLGSLSRRPYTSHATFLAKTARWTGLSVKSISDDSVVLEGKAVCPPQETQLFLNLYSSAQPGEIRFPEIAPSDAYFAVSQGTSRISSFFQARRDWLDANGRLEKYNGLLASLKRNVPDSTLRIDPETWAQRLDIKEIALVEIPSDKGRQRLVFVRPGREDDKIIDRSSSRSPHANRFRGFANAIAGNICPADDSVAVYRSGWIVSGSADAVASIKDGKSLSSSGILPVQKDASASVFFSVGADRQTIGKLFSSSMADAVTKTLAGASGEYFSLSVRGTDLTVTVERKHFSETAVPVAAKDSLSIPSGPFKVKNSATGKTNLFSQSKNGSLVLSEEGGKGIWAVPFDGKLCGRVCNIDYYANGKIQFLFAGGDKLYLIDRLGRFVKPFPVSVGKQIVLGPDAYDFTGAHGYSAMVLHADNTLGLYNLHGQKASGWQGIAPSDAIVDLPQLLTVKGKKYWVVRTCARTDIYPFSGGEPLTAKLTGGRAISPAGNVTVVKDEVSAICTDGKTRTIKL
ncbi:MAG: hypothetical protein ACI4AE_03885 [Candidatus Cryptobacteroides sp.]